MATEQIKNKSDVDALYNGNIAETFWKTASDYALRSYGYNYDHLNRLKNAVYRKPNDAIPVSGAYNESLSYDKNGNIKSLQRYGDSDAPSIVFKIDDLTYGYLDENSNQLVKVTEGLTGNDNAGFIDANKTGDDYAYDANGNMTSDKNKNITKIEYNQLNLPKKIIFGTTGTIEYIYNAAGQKLEKIVTDNSVVTSTNYLGGFQYKNNVLEFFPTAEGYVKNENGALSYVFQYKDHLGNVRVSYAKNLQTQVLEIIEENNYYPFGLKHKGYNDYLPITNKYKYNGKEFQDESIGGNQLNLYDYDARNYDPALGRWMNIDPLAEKGRRWSPYNYALDNPVYFLDPDGMLSQSFMDDLMKKSNAEGETIWTNNNNGTFSSNNGATVSDGESAESIDPPASTVSTQTLFGLATSLFGGTASFLKVAIIGTFSSAHTPDWSEGIFRTERAFGTFSIEDVKTEAKTTNATSKKGKDGSYTVTFSNGKTYHGKGPIDRMFTSALQKMTLFNVTVKKFDWNPAESAREAFKDEYRRMQTEATDVYPEGYANPVNYNIIQSPGKNYILQDGI